MRKKSYGVSFEVMDIVARLKGIKIFDTPPIEHLKTENISVAAASGPLPPHIISRNEKSYIIKYKLYYITLYYQIS